jgi:hypothetical protein
MSGHENRARLTLNSIFALKGEFVTDKNLATLPCCSTPQNSAGLELKDKALLPMFTPPSEDDEVCCGPRQEPRSGPFEKPGYRIQPFVEDFMMTSCGPVPRIKTRLDKQDRLGTFRVRAGFGRNDYKIAPGLYALGRPDLESSVLVTANYKLTFDTLRKESAGLNAWLLVLDTRGVNVWCAAGKKNFSTEEVISQARNTNLEKIVSHRKLILPQLSATGVSALKVKRGCGFEVVWGPVRARDIKAFLSAPSQADQSMRRVTFTLPERLVLTPVEITQAAKPLLLVLLILFLLSGIGPGIFSLTGLWHRGLMAAAFVILGVLSGTVFTPALLPWVPFRAFSLKGAVTGLVFGLGLIWFYSTPVAVLSSLALLLLMVTLSSYLAMNFTGCTPYTSPSGVEKEMRRALPLQTAAAALGLILWVVSAFLQPLL